MAYEHQQHVNQAAGSIMDAVDMFTDDTPDNEQIIGMIAAAGQAINASMAAVSAEQKKAYKAKFFAKLGVAIANRSLDKFLPDSES